VHDAQTVFAAMPYFSFKGGFGPFASRQAVTLIDGTPLLLSRTGYTGEFGFELFVAIERLPALWAMLLAAGEDSGLLACGLAARDSLRAGAVLPLSHQDIGSWPFLNNPWQFALPWSEEGGAFTKSFLGGQALLAGPANNYTLPFAGFDARKISSGEGSLVINEDGRRIGTILTCTTDMAIGRLGGEIVSVAADRDFAAKGLCCGFVLLDEPRVPGDQVVLSDGKRKLSVEIRADIRPLRTARRPMREML
jgi:aminomethyltransferase